MHFLGKIIERFAPMLWHRQLWGGIDVDERLKPLSLHHQPSQYHASVVGASDEEKWVWELITAELVPNRVRDNAPSIGIHRC